MSKLTKRAVEGLEPDPDRDYIVWDEEIPGFGLRITPKRVKTFLVQYRTPSLRSRRKSLGRFGVLTCEEARKQARLLLAQAKQGMDPAPKLLHASFNSVADRYLAEHAHPKKKPSSVAEDVRLLEKKIRPHLGNRDIRSIERETISRLHHQLSQTTPGSANRCLAILSKIFNLCEVWGLRPDNSNPCRHIQRNKERKMQRFLSPEELARLGNVLDEAEQAGEFLPGIILAIRLLIFTGARKGEILGLKWSMVDLKREMLHLPDSKTGPKTIPLNNPAIALLHNAPRRDDTEYVCPGKLAGKPIVGLQKAWVRIRSQAGLDDVRIHDFRHSFASFGASSGMGLPMIGALLGHTEPSTTARYSHLAQDPLRLASNRIGEELEAAMKGKAGATTNFSNDANSGESL